jgi:hypothetical protein
MDLIGPINSGDTTGGAGVSTANADSPNAIHGWLEAIYVKYNGSPPAGTTDVTVATKGAGQRPPAETLLSLVNAATDGWFYPRRQVDDVNGAAIAAEYDRFALADYVNVLIAQANDDDSIDVWLLVDRAGAARY